MRSRSWSILVFGFGILIVLIAVFGYGSIHKARVLHRETIDTHNQFLQTQALVQGVSAKVYLAAILTRDYLLDSADSATPSYRQQLYEVRSSLEKGLGALKLRMSKDDQDALQELGDTVNAYWQTLEPVYEWDAHKRARLGPAFIKEEVWPRRQAMVAQIQRLATLNSAGLRREQYNLAASQERFQRFLREMLGLCLGLGVAVTIAAMLRFWALERQAAKQREAIEKTGTELRKLSRRLVNAQEAERKSISRELHDAVGPLLTASRLELLRLESSRTDPRQFHEHVTEARDLNALTLDMIQNMAMGLRPSMLDDIGLGPALEWQGRQLARRSGIHVVVAIEDSWEHLPETHSTCIFRIVQEALTNCARHAHAKRVRVSLNGRRDLVEAMVEDDGVGFDTSDPKNKGLGLLGIEERVRELGGNAGVISERGKGTRITVELPIQAERMAA